MTILDDRPMFSRFVASVLFGGCVLWANGAAAQGTTPIVAAASLPSFALSPPAVGGESRWTGGFARFSTGFELSSSKRFGSYGGPTIGFEGGRMWQEGRLVYGVVGVVDLLVPGIGNTTPGFGSIGYSRDLSGAVQMKVGTLLTPDVMLYAKAGASAVHERLRFGPTSFSAPFTREDIAVRPDARVGIEWAVTDRLSVAVEAGVVGPGLLR